MVMLLLLMMMMLMVKVMRESGRRWRRRRMLLMLLLNVNVMHLMLLLLLMVMMQMIAEMIWAHLSVMLCYVVIISEIAVTTLGTQIQIVACLLIRHELFERRRADGRRRLALVAVGLIVVGVAIQVGIALEKV